MLRIVPISFSSSVPISNILSVFGVLILALCSAFCIYQWNIVKKFRGFPSQRQELTFCLLLLDKIRYRKDSITKAIFQIILNTAKSFQEKGICVLWFLKPYVIVYRGEHMKDLINSVDMADKSSLYDMNKLVFGNGLIGSKYEVWKVHRKMMNPAFNVSVLKTTMSVLNENALQLAEKLEMVKPTDDVCEILKECVFKNMADFVLGLKIEDERHMAIIENFIRYIDTIAAYFIKRVYSPWLYMNSFLPLFSAGRKYLKVLDEGDDVLREIINEFTADRQKASSQTINTCGNIIFNLHLQNSSFTERDVRDHLFNFTSAGYDTIAVTMLWCLYALATHPEVQEQAYCEVESVVPEGDITYDDLAKLKYLECVIKETLRLYPTVPCIARKARKDIKCGQYTIPKGTEVVFCIFMLHRDPNVFPEPEKFDPERFTDSSAIKSWMYIPFSEGLRNCIGKKFAIMEMKIQLVHFLRRFKITTEDRIGENDFDWNIVLLPERNIRFSFKNRHSKDMLMKSK